MDIKSQCFKIYKEAFGEDGDFSEKLFADCFKCCRYVLVGNTVASMCFLLPCELVGKKSKTKALYVFAVATAEDMRGKGYMTRLFNEIKKTEGLPLILRPANEGLVELYKKNGFLTGVANASRNEGTFLEPLGDFAIISNGEKEEEAEPFTVMYYGVNPQDYKELYFPYSMF